MTTPASPIDRRRFLGLAVGASTAAVLAGCGGGKSAGETAGGSKPTQSFSGTYDGPAVTLAYWNGFTGGDGPFMRKMVGEFQSANPNIKITQNTIQWADFYQRVPAAVTANKGPDVGVMHADQLATNAARKVIVPLDDVAKSLGLSEDDFTPDVWKAGIFQDARYGIPLDVHSLALYGNQKLTGPAGLSQLPTDEASYMEALQKLKSAGQPNPFWMPSRWPAHLMWLTLLWQNGGEPYNEDGTKALYDSEAGVKALEWMRSIVDKGFSPDNVAQDSQYVAFKGNKVALTWDGIWQINDLKGAKTQFQIAPIPKIGEKDAVWANSHNFFVTKQAAADDNKIQAAKVFIDYLSKKSAEWAGAAMIPARKSVREEAGVQQSTQAPIAAKIDNMRFLPPVPGLGDAQTQTLEPAVADAVLGKAKPADALKSAAAKASKLMEENKKKFGG